MSPSVHEATIAGCIMGPVVPWLHAEEVCVQWEQCTAVNPCVSYPQSAHSCFLCD